LSIQNTRLQWAWKMMENKCNACGEEFDTPEQVSDDEFGCPFCEGTDWDNINELIGGCDERL